MLASVLSVALTGALAAPEPAPILSLHGDAASPLANDAALKESSSDARAQRAKVRACVDRAHDGDVAKARKVVDNRGRKWK